MKRDCRSSISRICGPCLPTSDRAQAHARLRQRSSRRSAPSSASLWYGGAGRRQFLRGTGTGDQRLYPDRPRRPRLHEHADGRQAHAIPQLYATFLFGCCPSSSRTCPRWATSKPKLCFFFDEAHLLFNEAPSACSQDRADRKTDPLEGRWRLFRDPESARRAGRSWPSWAIACSMRCGRLHRASRRRSRPPRRSAPIRVRHRQSDHGARQGRGPGLVPRGQRPPMVERCIIRPPSGRMGTITPEERQAPMARARREGSMTRPSIPNPPTRSCRGARGPALRPGRSPGRRVRRQPPAAWR